MTSKRQVLLPKLSFSCLLILWRFDCLSFQILYAQSHIILDILLLMVIRSPSVEVCVLAFCFFKITTDASGVNIKPE